jgi:hypothetical protein
VAAQQSYTTAVRRQPELRISRVANFPGLRALTWDGNLLYASRGYELLSAAMGENPIRWRTVATYSPVWWRNLTVRSRLSFRLFRDGFHALAALPSGHLIAAVPGAIVVRSSGEPCFRVSHKILRGTRPLHIAVTPNGSIFWGEYFDNPNRDEVHIYASTDKGATWDIAYTFPRGAIRHVHNIVFDEWENCLWVLTGDNGAECQILRASFDFKDVQVIASGGQQARAVALIPTCEALFFSSDTPFQTNHIYSYSRRGILSQTAEINGSSIYGCNVRDAIFFSTMVEPSDTNRDRHVRVYGSADQIHWDCPLEWEKDMWPMGLFQYANAFLPDGHNATNLLAVTTIAVNQGDLETTIWRV